MKLALALGVAFGALTLTAYAQPQERDQHRVFVHAAGGHDLDADDDGFITRAEMIAAADRMFGHLDRNDDGRLNDADRPSMEEFNVRVDGPHDGDHVIRIERDGDEDGERVVRIIRNGEEVHAESHGERRSERHGEHDGDDDRNVIIMRGGRGGGEWTPEHGPVIAPLPPHPPMLMFMSTNIEEFDRNGDAALSQEEFRAQQLAQFEAQDGNRDGRIRAPQHMRAPEPPAPPEAPEPPQRPRRR